LRPRFYFTRERHVTDISVYLSNSPKVCPRPISSQVSGWRSETVRKFTQLIKYR